MTCTSVTSALEVFLNDMRYINPRFTYLLTYLLYLASIDLTKAFDTVNRELLWQILRKFGCPPAFLTILQEFLNGMQAKVTVAGREANLFDVLVGVKQGCVLS